MGLTSPCLMSASERVLRHALMMTSVRAREPASHGTERQHYVAWGVVNLNPQVKQPARERFRSGHYRSWDLSVQTGCLGGHGAL